MGMRSRLAMGLLLGAAVVMSACGAASDDSASVATTPAAQDGVGSLGDAVEVMAGAPAQADGAACDVDRQTLEIAVEAFYALNGSLPTSQSDLVEGQLVKELSPRFDISADGAVVPSATSPCT